MPTCELNKDCHTLFLRLPIGAFMEEKIMLYFDIFLKNYTLYDFTNTEVRMNAEIGQPCTRSLKGHVVSGGVDLCCCCVRCGAKKASHTL